MGDAMTLCSCKPFVRRNTDIETELYKSSYTRSHFYQNVVDHPLSNIRIKHEIRNELDVPDSVALDTLKSVSNSTFGHKYWANRNSTDFSRRSSLVSKPTLKSLDGKYIADPPRPLKWGSTTTGSTYVLPKKIHEPQTWIRASPIEESTCAVSSPCREGMPTFLPIESGYIKYMDPYNSTSQLTHCNFSEDQQNGVARKNIMTFWDTISLPKNRGFGLKKVEPFGSYFHRDKVAPYRVQAKSERRVPFFGNTSTYDDSYHFIPTNLMHREQEACYPAVYKPIDTSSYCTEQCHVGTGWPVRGSVDIGTVRGTY